MHTNSNPASRPHHHHPLKLLGNGRPHTHHKFQPEPRKSYPPSPTSTILPKKAPIFLDIHNRFQNIALLVSSRIIDFLSYDFNSIRYPSRSLLPSLSLSDDLQLHVPSGPSFARARVFVCESNKTKKYSPENMKRNEIRPFAGKRRARAPTLNLTSLFGAI